MTRTFRANIKNQRTRWPSWAMTKTPSDDGEAAYLGRQKKIKWYRCDAKNPRETLEQSYGKQRSLMRRIIRKRDSIRYT